MNKMIFCMLIFCMLILSIEIHKINIRLTYKKWFYSLNSYNLTLYISDFTLRLKMEFTSVCQIIIYVIANHELSLGSLANEVIKWLSDGKRAGESVDKWHWTLAFLRRAMLKQSTLNLVLTATKNKSVLMVEADAKCVVVNDIMRVKGEDPVEFAWNGRVNF